MKGIGLVEVLIATAIILITLSGLIAAYNFYLKNALLNLKTLQASLLAEEGIEALRSLRDTGFATQIVPLGTGTTHYFGWTGSTFTATTSNILIDGFYERKFVLDPVYRDSADKIAGGGTLDPNTKKVTVSVSWRVGNSTTTRSIATYLTNLFNN